MKMTNEELENRLSDLVRTERRITEEILRLVREAERRRLYLERGFPNLYEWLVQAYGYSHGAVHRRIQAARLLEKVPEVSEALQEGALNLTTLSQVQSAIQREEKRTGMIVPPEQKRGILEEVKGKTSEATMKILAEKFPEAAPARDDLRPRGENEWRLSVTMDDEGVRALKRSRELLFHVLAEGVLGQVVSRLAQEYVKRSDPLESVTDKRRVKIFQRADGQCEFVDESTGRRCSARTQLEIDHIVPKALGGTDDIENLRVLCRPHNLHEAARIFGEDLMRQYRRPS